MHKMQFFNNLKWKIRYIKTFGYYMEAYGTGTIWKHSYHGNHTR